MKVSTTVFVAACALQLPIAQGADALAGSLEEVVVTATKRAENLQEVPDAVTAFSANDIEQAKIETVADFARLTPNLSISEISQSPGVQFISIRGVTQLSNGEAPVAVIVDGVQVASTAAITQQLYDVERIEVLKGPQGALYGRNAIGGAINIVTRQPTNEFEARVGAGGGADGEFKALALVSGPIVSDKLFFRIAGNYANYDGGFENTVTGQKVDQMKDRGVRVLLTAKPTDAWNLDLRFSESRSNNAGYGAVVLPSDPATRAETFGIQPTAGRNGSGEREVKEASFKASYESDAGVWSSVTGYTKTEDQSSYDLDMTPAPLLDLALQRSIVDAYNQELRFTSAADRRFRYIVGGFYQHFELQRTTDVRVLFMPPPFNRAFSDASNESDAYAGFGQMSFDVTEQLELTAALRYDRDRRTQEDLLTGGRRTPKTFESWQPKFTVSYAWLPDLRTYATYSQGFRSGGFNAPLQAFPEGYDSEKTKNLEVGLKSEFLNNRLRLNLAAFKTKFDSQQAFNLDIFSGQQYITNIRSSDVTGAELELTVVPVVAWQFSLGTGYARPQIDDFDGTGLYRGNAPPYTPEWTYNAAVQYSHEVAHGWELQTRVDYAGQSGLYYEIINADKQKRFALTNLRIALESDRYSLSVYASNLFDEDYYADIASNFQTGGLGNFAIRGHQRRIGAFASVKF